MNTVDFSLWLQEQIDDKGWKPTDLARRSHISDAAVSRILKGERKADVETLSSFAHALKLPPEQVYRAAGILPPAHELDELVEQIIHETTDLPEQDQQEVLAFIRMKNNLRAQRKKK